MCIRDRQQVVGGAEISDDVLARLGAEDEAVSASATGQEIIACATVELVTTAATDQGVIAVAAEEFVLATPTNNRVIAAAAAQDVVSAPAEEHIRKRLADDGVVAAGTDIRSQFLSPESALPKSLQVPQT